MYNSKAIWYEISLAAFSSVISSIGWQQQQTYRYQTGIEKGIHQFIYRHLSLLDALQCSPYVCVDNNNNNNINTFSFFLYRSADAQTIWTQLRAKLISFGDLVATLEIWIQSSYIGIRIYKLSLSMYQNDSTRLYGYNKAMKIISNERYFQWGSSSDDPMKILHQSSSEYEKITTITSLFFFVFFSYFVAARSVLLFWLVLSHGYNLTASFTIAQYRPTNRVYVSILEQIYFSIFDSSVFEILVKQPLCHIPYNISQYFFFQKNIIFCSFCYFN